MIEIRELKKEDNFKDLFSLSKEFFREYQKHERKYFEINKLSQKNIIEFFKKTLNSPTEKCFIAIENQKIVGYISIHIKIRPSFYKIKK